MDGLDAFLQPLPEERRDAVGAWLNSTLGDRPTCDAPVLVGDSHRLIKVGIAHTGCVPQDA